MIHSLAILLLLLSIVLALEALAKRMAVLSPFLLLPAGIALGFMDGFPRVALDPELVLYAFLPPLVYVGAATGSWSEYRKAARPIALLSVGCVLFTAAATAAAARAFIPGFDWPTAVVLGAIVAPPDVVTAVSIARRLGIPKGLTAVLEGEGLLNDATALTVFRLAVAAAAAGSPAFSMKSAAAGFALIVAGELAWGFAAGWALLKLRREVRDTSLEIGLSLLTPFAAYLPAVQLGGSGVLAAAAAGLYVNYRNSRFVPATTRLQLRPVWESIQFVLEGILFLVAGMQLRWILEPVGSAGYGPPLAYGLMISLLVVLLRFLWVFPMFGDRRTAFIVSWSGMRGTISLAAALAIPLTAAGRPFPQRSLVIFLTFCVIVATLILQGLSLPALIRRLKVDRDGIKERAAAGHREIEARLRAAQAALALLSRRREEKAYPDALLDRLEEQYRYRGAQFRAHLGGDHDGAVQHGTHSFNAQTELIETERRAMLELRETGVIDDLIMRRIETDLDLQEMRLRQGITEWTLFADEHVLPAE